MQVHEIKVHDHACNPAPRALRQQQIHAEHSLLCLSAVIARSGGSAPDQRASMRNVEKTYSPLGSLVARSGREGVSRAGLILTARRVVWSATNWLDKVQQATEDQAGDPFPHPSRLRTQTCPCRRSPAFLCKHVTQLGMLPLTRSKTCQQLQLLQPQAICPAAAAPPAADKPHHQLRTAAPVQSS